MLTQIQQKTGGVTHIWPSPTVADLEQVAPEYVAEVYEDEETGRKLYTLIPPASDLSEVDIWKEIAGLTLNHDAKGYVFVAPNGKGRDGFMPNLKRFRLCADRLKELVPPDVEEKIFYPPSEADDMELLGYRENPALGTYKDQYGKEHIRCEEYVVDTLETPAYPHGHTVKEKRPHHFNLKSQEDAQHIKDCYHKKHISALVLWHPWEDQLTHLEWLSEKCPNLPIYVFHYYISPDIKWGVERDGVEGNWQGKFHTKTQALTIPETVDVVVRGLCNVGNISIWGALPKHGKSYLFLSIMKSLLSAEPWLGHFEVSKSKRVVYLVPEVGLRGVMKRLRKLRMVEYLYDPITNPNGRLFVQTLSSADKLKLDSAALLLAVRGADVFVDPLIRYIEGDENNATDQRILSGKLLDLISAEARSVWCAHHSPKAFKDVTDITTQNVLRGTGEFAAFPDNIFGIMKTNEEASRLYIKCTDARDDDEHLGVFEVEMRPWIDETGDLKLIVEPGTGTPLSKQRKAGRKVDQDKQAKLAFLRTITGSAQEKTDALNKQFNSEHSRETVRLWTKEFDEDKETL
jgi:AAA domain